VQNARTAGHQDVTVLVLKDVIGLRFIPCHRMPSRSPHWFGRQFPLCYRCLSILIGYLATPVFLAANLRFPIWLGVLLNLPMLIDGFTQYRKWRTSNNALRVVTGLLSGVGQSMVIATCSLWLSAWLLRWV
jgi:uncharacterized membrane protein